MRRVAASAGVSLLSLMLPLAAAAEPRVVDFTKEVQPILQQHCVKCHGPEEQNGGLRYDDKAGAFAQGDSGGHAIVAGKPEESQLLKRITSTHTKEQMPPKGARLSAAEVATLKAWITSGAEWPAHAVVEKTEKTGTDHWSFQPVTKPAPPSVKDAAWALTPLDRFIQAPREAAGLTPSPDADPVALIRRATYDLTGLPPTPAEVKTFVEACRKPGGTPAAFVSLVNRLLDSPRYGERWGRHWMDWVRYADTAGDNSDYPIPQAFLYRNYIIASFNADVPYHRFLTEQIAGDLLPAKTQTEKNRQTIATGYLAMARRFGSLVERYPWHLTIEDTLDNMGRTMMGLTLSCARCHDHKFDPISTRDYYGLYGIFASTRYPFPGIELFKTQRDFVPLVPKDEFTKAMKPYQAKTDELTKELERLLALCEEKTLENAAREGERSLEEQRKAGDELDDMLMQARKAGEALADHLKTIPAIPTAYAVQEAKPVNARVQIKGEPDRLGAEVPRRFLEVLGGQTLPPSAQSGSGRLELAKWITDEKNPLTARVMVNRVWQRHFGRGLVPSTSDFGLRGEKPTHPELLDWLAGEFMRSGWSLKHLHRLIMTSRTYQLSSRDQDDNVASDPGNKLYWKFNRHRLDAESLRDTLLYISGGLDGAPQAKPHPFPPSKQWGYTQHHPFKDDYPSSKRSVYLMTKRLTAKSYFQTFDGADPNVCTSSRDSSVTALQALYFVNDKFLHEQADRFTKKIVRQSQNDEERLDNAFTAILSRLPDEEESTMMLGYLNEMRQRMHPDPAGDLQAWSSVIRSLFRLNEFMYLD
jgi:mono/diheme cytochrome c family protein